MVILAYIREQHRLSLQNYELPRMTDELQELGVSVGQLHEVRLMRDNGIKIIRAQTYKATTNSNHAFNIAPNLLDQGFSATGPNQKWAGDISYIWTSEGWLYLAVILDLYSRRVIGCAVSNRMKRGISRFMLLIWQLHCVSHPKGAFIIPAGDHNTAHTTTKNASKSTALKYQWAAKAIDTTIPW
tara:strand:+ start:78 stop:632 length:555 start_codon:yes stop_codon:yes gene_type:complete